MSPAVADPKPVPVGELVGEVEAKGPVAPPAPSERPPAAPLVRGALIALGVAAVAMGAIGVVIPGWPTTVFVILALWCFARSSPRLEAWLMAWPPLRFATKYIDGSTPFTHRHRAVVIACVWGMIALSIASMIWPFGLRGIGLGAAAGGALIGAMIGSWFIATWEPTRRTNPRPDPLPTTETRA